MQTDFTKFDQLQETPQPQESDYNSSQEYLKALLEWREETGNITEYQERIEAKAERYEERSQKASERATSSMKRSHSYTDGIVFGQPILVGHHSESKHRNAIKRSHSAIRKSIEESDKAQYYSQRAETVKANKSISSDDQDAIIKLKAKIEKAQEKQTLMKAVNSAIRLKDQDKGNAKLKDMGISESNIIKLREPDFCGRVGFPSFELTNNNSNMKRMKDRLSLLESQAQDETQEIKFNDGVIIDNVEINRLQIIYDDIPDQETRNKLKSNGFRWSRNEGAWQRKRSRYATDTAKRLTGAKSPSHQPDQPQETEISQDDYSAIMGELELNQVPIFHDSEEPEPIQETEIELNDIEGKLINNITIGVNMQFVKGDIVTSAIGDKYTVKEAHTDDNFISVIDDKGEEYQGLKEAFKPATIKGAD